MDRSSPRFRSACVGFLVAALYVAGSVIAAGEQAGTVTDRDARAFVESWIDLSQKNENFDRVMGFYADEVDFYKLGRVKKSAVAADKRKYFDRWPTRTYRITSVSLLPGEDGREKRIEAAFHYRIQNAAGRVLEGDARTFLVLRMTSSRLLIAAEFDAATKAAATPPGGAEFLVWIRPKEHKESVRTANETVWVDGNGRVLRRSKAKELISVMRDAVYTVRIEKRKVMMADCFGGDGADPEAKPSQAEAMEPEMAVLKTEADGSQSRTVVIPAEGDEYGEQSTNIDVLGAVGPWLFVVPGTYYFGCGAAHGGTGYGMIILNIESGEDILASPSQKRRPDKQRQKKHGSSRTLFTQKEYDKVMKALGSRAIKAINDEMITSTVDLELTKVRPVVQRDALGLEVMLTGDTCYACSDGLWNSYTRSAAFVAPALPEFLAPYRNIPPAVLKWMRANSVAEFPSWSVVPDNGPLRRQIEMMFR